LRAAVRALCGKTPCRPKVNDDDLAANATDKEVPSMLVLSRREQETIVLPAIKTTIQVLKLRGQVARIGIEAPGDLQILRGEIARDTAGGSAEEEDIFLRHKAARQEVHALRDRLNEAGVGAHFARKLLELGEVENSRMAMDAVLEAIKGHASPHAALTRCGRSGRPRTLLVEDNANERQLMAGLLRANGFDVQVAGDGEEALGYLSGEIRPDVVLMDMMMPRCDGVTAVRRIRSTPSLEGLKIFAISGSTQRDVGLETGPTGVDRWYSKPLDPDHLVGELTQELHRTYP
jgi:carbon storage regulator CsrA